MKRLFATMLVVGALATQTHADFTLADFSDTTAYTTVGDAVLAGNGLHVDLTQPVTNQAGALWAAAQQDISGDFTISFRFGIFNGPGADGMALVIQAVGPNQLTTGQGGFLGYNGIVGALAVELDMYNNSTFGDLDGNHISIHRNGDVMATGEIATTSNLAPMADGMVHTVTIQQLAGMFSVSFDGTVVLSTLLSPATEVGASTAYIGFTAATGGLFHRHRVLDLSFTSGNPPVGPQLVRGDCDDTGGVNLADAIWLLGFLFPQGAPANPLNCEKACDSNDDGSINLVDAVAILNALFGTPIVPLPGPASCDVDATVDTLTCATSISCP